jgi:hypothetical protein
LLDFASEVTYVWDPAAKVARPTGISEGDQALRRFPTVTAATFSEWRRQFATASRESLGVYPLAQSQLSEWQERGLGTHALPIALQNRWNAFLKRKVVDALEQWFTAESIPIPADLLRPVIDRKAVVDAETTLLRRFLLECIRQMTADEMRSVQIPAAAAARIRDRRSHEGYD